MSIGREYEYNILEWLKIGSSSIKIDFWVFING